MQSIRGHLNGDVEGVIGNARQLISWKRYVRAYPWASLLAAAAIGYIAVPRRLATIRPDAETLAQLVREKRLIVEDRQATRPASGLAHSLIGMLGKTLLRAGIAYLGQQVGQAFSEQAAANNET